MAYFDCIVGGSGGNLKLTVTCESGFAGATISCTDGTTTLTATCPSSSPYTVIFKIPNGGTWIVSSGSNSTTVVIPETATLHQIPTGSTATPVNVIQTWLHCANIWDKTYTTINQVLADTSTLLALISSNNAADYMARSTNWASSVCANVTAMGYIGNNNYCANKLLANSTWLNAIRNSTYFESVLNVKIPTMTGYTTPSGKVTASSEYSGDYLAWKAFNSSDSSFGWVSNGAIGSWVKYQFANSGMTAYKVRFYHYYTTSYPVDFTFKVQGSNDDSTFTDITPETRITSVNTEYVINLNNTTKYKYYRFVVTAGQQQYGMGTHIQIWGR